MKHPTTAEPAAFPDRSRVYNTLATVMIAIALAAGIWLARPGPAATEAVQVKAANHIRAAAAQRPDPDPSAAPAGTTTTTAMALEKRWGIQVSSISLANGESAVDLRYTVTVPAKTLLLTGADAEVYLIDQASGAKLTAITAPPVGTASAEMPSRTVRKMMHQAGLFPPPSSRLLAGGSYSLLIPNWDGVLKSGAKVTVVIGNYRVDDLIVE